MRTYEVNLQVVVGWCDVFAWLTGGYPFPCAAGKVAPQATEGGVPTTEPVAAPSTIATAMVPLPRGCATGEESRLPPSR